MELPISTKRKKWSPPSTSHGRGPNQSSCGSPRERERLIQQWKTLSAVDRPRVSPTQVCASCGLSHVDWLSPFSHHPHGPLSRLASAVAISDWGVYQLAPLRLLEGDEVDDPAEAAADCRIQPSAISAASSLALLMFLPSYQNRAATVCPLTTTRLDQAVRPPRGAFLLVCVIGPRQSHAAAARCEVSAGK